ncbi:caspase family protein [Ruegeria marina]|uniref:Caspase domain-containing protein n=1 Tax=Ruegeria marina TaxID=639004 RepID=A0A1G6Q728_9RHOB|nr:caspase family protein [Ruegeria marina]SDC88031.1 Caspase domain-containing protein [Ruegeria marina]
MRVLLLLLLLSWPVAGWAKQVALVIGNAAYQNVAPLANPENDANAVSEALTRQGFEVVKATNLTLVETYRTLREFRDLADTSDVAMIYYAGHGIEIGGQNFLIPVDARLADERDAQTEMVNMDVLLSQLSGARKLKMVVLDACRDNPFVQRMERQGKSRNIGRGLAMVANAEAATLIAYAAAAGEVTPDGKKGGNSPFTRAFLNALDQPPADVRVLMGAVRDELTKAVPGAVPFVYSSLGKEEIVINPNSRAAETAQPAQPQPAPGPAQEELTEDTLLRDFAMAEYAGSIDAWDMFLDKYRAFPSHMLYILALRSRKQLSEHILPVRPPGVTMAPPIQPAPEGPVPEAAPQVTVEPMTEAPPRMANDLVSPTVPEPAELAALPQEVTESAVPTQDGEEQDTNRAMPPIMLNREAALRAVQEILKERNCYGGKIDGLWGRGSSSGLSRLINELGLDLDFSTRPDVQELNDILAVLEQAEPGDCPIIARAPSPSKPQARVRTAPAPNPVTKTVPAPAPVQPGKQRKPSWACTGSGYADPNAGC